MFATVGAILGALLRQFLISRAVLWGLRRANLGDTLRRVLIGHVLTYVIAVLACAYGLPHDGPPPILGQAMSNLAPSLFWLAVDVLRMMRRRAKIRDSVYISRMR